MPVPVPPVTAPVTPPPSAAIVLAAGRGTRMRSATTKVLHAIGGRTLLGHAVHAVAALDPAHLVVVLGHDREQVTAAVGGLGDELGRPVHVAVQDRQLGTGHAVSCGLDALPPDLTGPVLVSSGDVPLLETPTLHALLAEHAVAGAAVTVLTTEPADASGYGRVLRDVDGAVTAIIEERDATAGQRAIREINSGVYVFDAAFLRSAVPRLSTSNSQGELYLTDLVALAHTDGAVAAAVVCEDAWQVAGVNDRVQLAALRAELNRRVLVHWMREGVTVVDPATTWVDVQVQLAADVTLHPGTQLHGVTSVDGGAEIGPDTTLTSCEIGAGATVVRTHGSESVIGAGASVGPFAYLRPGARLGDRGKIGTFVEVKNADIGAGTKVPHLTYVGDATIGEHSNIGASSVFVNYDGVRKQRTVVGSHVKTGSDNTFVAPVQVGDGAYTGAGTVVRDDVPPGALAVSAGSQRTIEGWVERKRPGTPAAEAAARASSVNSSNGGTQR
ncbi:bifunctional UDP-N-acetylglucosamine diphosphorylase/glucosamine-1-phosphate N-acetyltransferase GlmU [Pseudonocardia sp. KRD-184]|uniref:Bifunctional protein GlmU n=1 Tax=Pseudonocardia oceani TaxID=2792013 RepID=A0ABS6UBJ0_9PSEU|nr:bifunctional UDP-N-acetylglucosamine diphosphorylase/glucosamine-1-phosphate N-acetyltransferase GlmU [Pseudonocardia oceani]MBW0092893.1 bifunctional UDP-N-acetylglucosamine diphosphorylase/glucosamine-1-phosphate N-acetyltransferase GlmU [Pseudonocardia oceani]MBW0099693.1 bifunctional UDP-N-acetylglucosamine diphosphorylase/glucosamine-1-phosphate N-acetyltransferase GlmU [Pseudonocardia oceani]MBW0112352.1 bifunctional UDP-N-acetylglucosamine diphosphorylase/glucosamine-1-phosphate N-acet